MALLTLKQIKDANDLKVVRVPMPEWGGDDAFVYIRNLKAWQRDRFEAEVGKGDSLHLYARLVAMSLCDEQGNFYDPTEEDIIELSEKSAAAMSRLADECCRLSRIGALGKEAYRELEKNLPGQSESSGGG